MVSLSPVVLLVARLPVDHLLRLVVGVLDAGVVARDGVGQDVGLADDDAGPVSLVVR